ncbi:hypothetical protein [Rhodococcus sp. OK519]|uniref:hypothetical protein n=1 Tax=Rhodococcus sp. OK519 TaxID=2135729 RepID=UPI002159B1F3
MPGVPAHTLDELRRPVGVQVMGRAGVGRSTVVSLLERSGFANVVEAPAVDAPGRPDPEAGPDVVVYVFTGALHTPDVRALAAAPSGSTVAVLNKADTLGSWDEAVWAANTAAAEAGVRTVPRADGTAADAVHAVVDHAIRVVRARRIHIALDALATVGAADPDGAVRDGIECFLRSDRAVLAAAESAALVAGDGAGDRRRREIAERRARTRRAVAAGPAR